MNIKTKLKHIILTVCILAVGATAVFAQPAPTMAATTDQTLTSSPYAKIDYGYTGNVSTGTIRYMSQLIWNADFDSRYWGSRWKYSAIRECGTCCISMALSYIGINETPQSILDYGNGSTYFTHSWGGSTVSYLSFAEAFQKYESGAGTYSPPIIHLNKYSLSGHFVLVVGRVSGNVYQVVDPANSKVWNMTINGNTATYSRLGTKTEDLATARQYYNPNAKVKKPAKVVVKSINNSAKKKLTLTWKKINYATGYQIYRATDANGSYKRIKTITKNKTVKYTNKNLQSGTTYYYKVRAYKSVGSKKVYGKFSTPVSQIVR